MGFRLLCAGVFVVGALETSVDERGGLTLGRVQLRACVIHAFSWE